MERIKSSEVIPAESVEAYLRRRLNEDVDKTLDLRRTDYANKIDPNSDSNLDFFERRYKIIDSVLGIYKQGELDILLDKIDPLKTNKIARINLELASTNSRDLTLDVITDSIFRKLEDEEIDRDVLKNKFTELEMNMLKEGTKHNEVWTRSTYGVADEILNEFYERMIDLGFSFLIKNHEFPDPKADRINYPELIKMDYRKEKPDFAYVSVNSYEYSDDDKWNRKSNKDIQLVIGYNNETKTSYDRVIIPLRIQESLASSYVFSMDYLETGYEGHDHLALPMFNKDWEKIYSLIKEYATVAHKERPIEERMKDWVMTDSETGKEYSYNTETKKWDIEIPPQTT